MTPDRLDELLPANAKELVDGAAKWIRENPAEAAVLVTAGGFLLGLAGIGRVFQRIGALRGTPLFSDAVLGAVAQGLRSSSNKNPAPTNVIH